MARSIAAWMIWGAVALAAVLPARAELTNPALAAQFQNGNYLRAAEAAEQHGSADDLAFAARSLLALCMTGSGEVDPVLLERAFQDAARAVALDEGHVEGRLQLAIAASLKTRSMGLMEANRSGLGALGKALAESVLEDDPQNFYAHGFAAVWHVEVRRRAGGLGSMMVGASTREGREHYARAAELAPDDVGIHWQFGRALVALDSRKYRREAEAALMAGIEAQAGDHVERVMQARAEQLLSVLREDRKAAEALALELL